MPQQLRRGFFLLLTAVWSIPSLCKAQLTAQRLLVVYNLNAPGSEQLAREYATNKGVPPHLLAAIACSTQETVSWDEYVETIREPILHFLEKNKLIERAQSHAVVNGATRSLLVTIRCQIDGILLSYGIPLSIAHNPSFLDETVPQHFQTTAAAVDSELATALTWGLNPTGPLPNPFFQSQTPFRHPEQPPIRMLLVTRLDGPDPETVRQRMRQAMQVEQSGGLRGLGLFDARGLTEPPLKIGDEWIITAARLFRKAAFKTRLDDHPAQFPADAHYTNVVYYLGWYSAHPEGIFTNPQFSLAPGAVAYHIHSFSAQSVRSSTSHWVGPLIAKGAAVTMGSVAEPYLGMTPHLDIFTDRLLRGWTFAEAAYAAQPALSWMITFVGDPLYRPFPTAPLTQQKNSSPPAQVPDSKTLPPPRNPKPPPHTKPR